MRTLKQQKDRDKTRRKTLLEAKAKLEEKILMPGIPAKKKTGLKKRIKEYANELAYMDAYPAAMRKQISGTIVMPPTGNVSVEGQ